MISDIQKGKMGIDDRARQLTESIAAGVIPGGLALIQQIKTENPKGRGRPYKIATLVSMLGIRRNAKRVSDDDRLILSVIFAPSIIRFTTLLVLVTTLFTWARYCSGRSKPYSSSK